MAMERLENLSHELTEGRSNVIVEEERVERVGWNARIREKRFNVMQCDHRSM